jgi:outer membrane protein assembly factor BamB
MLVVGCVIVLIAAVRQPVLKAAASVLVAAALVAGAVLAVTGIPHSMKRWDYRVFEGLSSFSARTGDLLISGGTAYDVQSVKVTWKFEGESVDEMLVRSDIVVLGTRDETVGLETSTGRELWRSPIAGAGFSVNGDALVISHWISETEPEVVALDVGTGDILWQLDGEPIMECDLGPANRYSVAPDRSHVLIADEDMGTDLVSVLDGSTSIEGVDCSVTARVLGDVLIEALGNTLVGRSLTDGTQLWATQVDEPWLIAGGGSEVITTTDSDKNYADIIAIDVSSGEERSVKPPQGRVRYLSSVEHFRSAEVWLLVDLGPGAAIWNPTTEEFIEIPNASNVNDIGIDVYSGWMALTGSTTDITGDVTPQCWALSPSGDLFGPAPGPGCYVDEGILQTGDGVYPLQ